MENNVSATAKEINAQLETLEAERLKIGLKGFALLEQQDTETARLALEAFGQQEHAALWLTDMCGRWAG